MWPMEVGTRKRKDLVGQLRSERSGSVGQRRIERKISNKETGAVLERASGGDAVVDASKDLPPSSRPRETTMMASLFGLTLISLRI